MKRLFAFGMLFAVLLPHSVFAEPLSAPTQANRNTIKFYYDQTITKYYDSLIDFEDISPWDESFGIVKYFVSEGLINSGATFDPYRYMTRAEFITLFAKIKNPNLAPASVRPFPDVPTNAWYARSVAYTKSLGVLNGYPDGNFHPDDPITRQGAYKLLGIAYDNTSVAPMTRIDGLQLLYESFPQYKLYPKPNLDSINITLDEKDILLNGQPLRALFVNFVTKNGQYSEDYLRSEFKNIYALGFRGISIEIPWVAIEPTDDTFVFPSYYDRLITIAKEEGLLVDILLSPHYTPSWIFEKYGDIYMYDNNGKKIVVDNLNVEKVPEGAYMTFSIHSPAVLDQKHWQKMSIRHYEEFSNVISIFLTNEQTYPMHQLADYSSWANQSWNTWRQEINIELPEEMPKNPQDPYFFAFQRFRQDALNDYFNELYDSATQARSRFIPLAHKTLFYESTANFAVEYGLRPSGIELKGDIVGNDIYGFSPNTYAAQSSFRKPIFLVETNLTGNWNDTDMYHYLMYQFLHGATIQSVFRWNPGSDGNTLHNPDGSANAKLYGASRAARVINATERTLPVEPPNFGIIVPYHTLSTMSWDYTELQHTFDDIYLIGDQMRGMVPSLIWSDNISVENYYKRPKNQDTLALNNYQYIFAPITKSDLQAVNNEKMRDWVSSGGWLLVKPELKGLVNWVPQEKREDFEIPFGKGKVYYCKWQECVLNK
jgi:hypothetical protein